MKIAGIIGFTIGFLIGLLILGPTIADADSWTQANTLKAIAVAEAHWPGSPCAGREDIRWETESQINAFILTPGVIKAGALGTTQAYSIVPKCLVVVGWDILLNMSHYLKVNKNVYLCTTLEHEFGHLAGYTNAKGYSEGDYVDHAHSPDRHSVMYPYASLSTIQPDCRNAVWSR